MNRITINMFFNYTPIPAWGTCRWLLAGLAGMERANGIFPFCSLCSLWTICISTAKIIWGSFQPSPWEKRVKSSRQKWIKDWTPQNQCMSVTFLVAKLLMSVRASAVRFRRVSKTIYFNRIQTNPIQLKLFIFFSQYFSFF